MNNNNRGNNRRRGRGNSGNNRPQGGGQQTNRIDSRARGNAPQLLEKYRKLALDAQLNGDRVTEEYYHQFADHYFRVIADTRQRLEDQRVRRDEPYREGGESYREDGDDSGDFGGEGEVAGYEQPGSGNGNSNNRPERAERPEGAERPERAERPRREERSVSNSAGGEGQDEGGEQRSPYEPAENPFVREARPARAPRARREDRRPRREETAEGASADVPAAPAPAPAPAPARTLDPALLPPAIGARAEVVSADVKPKRRAPRRKPAADDAGETLESSVTE